MGAQIVLSHTVAPVDAVPLYVRLIVNEDITITTNALPFFVHVRCAYATDLQTHAVTKRAGSRMSIAHRLSVNSIAAATATTRTQTTRYCDGVAEQTRSPSGTRACATCGLCRGD